MSDQKKMTAGETVAKMLALKRENDALRMKVARLEAENEHLINKSHAYAESTVWPFKKKYVPAKWFNHVNSDLYTAQRALLELKCKSADTEQLREDLANAQKVIGSLQGKLVGASMRNLNQSVELRTLNDVLARRKRAAKRRREMEAAKKGFDKAAEIASDVGVGTTVGVLRV